MSANAEIVSLDRDTIDAQISNTNGKLFDWSKTSLRIQQIFFDNPVAFHRSFLFTTDGCKKNICTNASLLNITVRPNSVTNRGSFKVVLANRRGKKYIYTVNISRVDTIRDSIVTFSPTAILANSSQTTANSLNSIQHNNSRINSRSPDSNQTRQSP